MAGDDPLSAPIEENERALIKYALKLSRDPGSIERQDVQALREAGWDDRAIHDACNIVAYYNYVNRVAHGLGVELEPGRSIPEVV